MFLSMFHSHLDQALSICHAHSKPHQTTAHIAVSLSDASCHLSKTFDTCVHNAHSVATHAIFHNLPPHTSFQTDQATHVGAAVCIRSKAVLDHLYSGLSVSCHTLTDSSIAAQALSCCDLLISHNFSAHAVAIFAIHLGSHVAESTSHQTKSDHCCVAVTNHKAEAIGFHISNHFFAFLNHFITSTVGFFF